MSSTGRGGPRRLAAKLGLFVASNLLALACLELALRVAYPLWAGHDSELWRYAAGMLEPANHPGLRHQHRPDRELELYGTTIRTEAHGLRDERVVTDHPAPGTRRVLLLGDSITLAWGVDWSDSYGQVLERLLEESTGRDHELLNAGVAGYDSASLAAAWEQRAELEPAVVLVAFYINDIERAPSGGSLWSWLGSHLHLKPFFQRGLLGLLAPDYRDLYTERYADPAATGRLVADLRGLLASVRGRGLPLVFVHIPELHGFDPYPFPQVHRLIEERVLADSEACYVDLLPALAGHEPTSLWVSPEDHHPNAAGHELMARAILEACGPVLAGAAPIPEPSTR